MIKIASMVGAPDLEIPTLAPYSGDLESAFRKLSALGYDGIELMVRHPGRLDGLRLRQLLDEYHLILVGLCTGHVFGEDHLGLVGPDLRLNPLALERAKEFVDFAGEYFAPGTLINIGRFRGVANPDCPEESLRAFAAAFQEVADYAAPRQVRVILEPVSRNEVNYLHSSADGMDMVRRVGRPNFGLMLDTYHMDREDADMFDSMVKAGSMCWHMHFSDSNRCHPGSATIPFERIVALLDRMGYAGFVGMEIKAWPDPDAAARNSIAYLRQFIPVLSS